MENSDRYWTVDLPGLTEEDAEQIAAADYPGVIGASSVDPRISLTLHLDVETVRHMADLMRHGKRDDIVDGIGTLKANARSRSAAVTVGFVDQRIDPRTLVPLKRVPTSHVVASPSHTASTVSGLNEPIAVMSVMRS